MNLLRIGGIIMGVVLVPYGLYLWLYKKDKSGIWIFIWGLAMFLLVFFKKPNLVNLKLQVLLRLIDEKMKL